MKIVQVVDSYNNGNGVGNCLQSIADALDKLEIENVVWTRRTDRQNMDGRVHIFRKADEISLEERDIIFYHFCLGMRLNYEIQKLPCKKVLIYQNVTPPHFFYDISLAKFKECLWGYYDAKRTAAYYSKCIVPSEFSKRDLAEMGWKPENIEVIPLITLQKNTPKTTETLIKRYRDGYVNFIFTGRIVPNKKIEDIIRIFGFYQKNINRRSRLFLAGAVSYQNYYLALWEYIKALQLEDVIFTGKISQEDLEAYYVLADIYLCMSEHEGFCLPLIEAMQREIPVVAYAKTAVPDTMGEAGVLVETKDARTVCEQIKRIIEDSDFRKKIIAGQKERVNVFNLDRYKDQMYRLIQDVNGEDNGLDERDEKGLHIEDEVTCRIREAIDRILIQEGQRMCIIYGMGESGKELFDRLDECELKIVCCDNRLAGIQYMGQAILSHEECVATYPQGIYIITVQNSPIAIAARLLQDGVKEKQIRFYNNIDIVN